MLEKQSGHLPRNMNPADDRFVLKNRELVRTNQSSRLKTALTYS